MRARRLLLALHEARIGGFAWVLLAVVAAPLVGLAGVLDVVESWGRTRALAGALKTTSVTCPRGHVVELKDAALRCPSCGLVFEGHAFAPCAHCGEIAAVATLCSCGLPIRNPLVGLDGELL